MARDALAEEEARARIRAQMPLGEKRRFGHYEVDTSGTLDDTDAAADRLAAALAALRLPLPSTCPAIASPAASSTGRASVRAVSHKASFSARSQRTGASSWSVS